MNHEGRKQEQPEYFIVSESLNKKQHINDTVPQSPQRTWVQKVTFENPLSSKSSEELLTHIYTLLQTQNTISRRDSQKSVDRKDANGNFKCKCKKTKCLKMYCQCFALGKLCNGCQCCDCQNVLEFEQARASAIDEALQRDPDVFQTAAVMKKGGCICKKTECLKKYCECFSSGVACGPQCKCQNCSNRQ